MQDTDFLNADGVFRETTDPRQLCHVGTTIEHIPYLAHVLGEMPYRTIHFYTPLPGVADGIRRLDWPDKVVIPHVAEGVYSERWLFELSRRIAERRISELLGLAPDVLRLKQFPEVSFEKLAIRRVSLSRLYYELSVFFALQQQLTTDEHSPLIFYSNFFDRADVEAFNLSPSISVVPQLIRDIPSPSRISRIKRQILKALVQVAPLLGEVRKNQVQQVLRRNLEKVEALYNDMRRHPPFLQFRLLDKMIRHQYKSWIRKFKKFRAQLDKLKLLIAMWLVKRFIHCVTRQCQEKILVISPSITKRNKGYYLRLFKPVVRQLLSRHKALVFMLWAQDRKTSESFVKLVSADKASDTLENRGSANFLPVTSRFELFREQAELFLENVNLVPPDEPGSSQSHLLGNTLNSINSLKYAIALVYWYTKGLEFDKVLGVEEDIEYVSILNKLKLVLGKQYDTFIVPSCLPEYSVCYDCVDVDHLSVALPFIGRIFAEQNVNANQIHLVGSQEWEEGYNQKATFPEDIERLIVDSSFVLGVLHQPIFVTMHGQTIYNNLTVNFLGIYECFLARHPDACILIKPHPRDDLAQLKAYLPESDRIVVLPQDTPNKLLYHRVDAAISIHSTMITHAMAHGVPVVSLYKYPDYVPLYDFINETGGLATDSHDEALAWLARVQTDAAFRAEVCGKMAVLREQCLSVAASQRIADILEMAGPAG